MAELHYLAQRTRHRVSAVTLVLLRTATGLCAPPAAADGNTSSLVLQTRTSVTAGTGFTATVTAHESHTELDSGCRGKPIRLLRSRPIVFAGSCPPR